jgi:hypothetical protein
MPHDKVGMRIVGIELQSPFVFCVYLWVVARSRERPAETGLITAPPNRHTLTAPDGSEQGQSHPGLRRGLPGRNQ